MGAKDQGATADRWQVVPRTLVFLSNDGDVLLQKRSQHKKVFPGRYNGVGGHIERGETPLQGATREVAEDTGLAPVQVSNLRLRGISHIDAGGAGGPGVMLFIFMGEATTRAVNVESEEGTLHWIPIAQVIALHADELVEDLPLLLPRLYGGASADVFYAHVHYDSQDRMVVAFHSER
jgi:8-oxo-dGTP diphosphatase